MISYASLGVRPTAYAMRKLKILRRWTWFTGIYERGGKLAGSHVKFRDL